MLARVHDQVPSAATGTFWATTVPYTFCTVIVLPGVALPVKVNAVPGV